MLTKTFGVCPDWKSMLDSVNSGVAPDILDSCALQTHLALCDGCMDALSETGDEILSGCLYYRDDIDRINQGEELMGEEYDLFWMHLGLCLRCRNRLNDLWQRKIESIRSGGA